MKAWLLRLSLLVFSVTLAVAVVEVGLRLWRTGALVSDPGGGALREPHRTRGWALRPGAKGRAVTIDYAVDVEVNALGLRDEPRRYAKEPGVERIVILGDSFMEAEQVRYEQSLAGRLPALLRALVPGREFETVNLGVAGYSTAQSLRQLEEEGLRYRPDVVVLSLFVGNDVRENSPLLLSALFGSEDPQIYGRPFATAEDWSAPLVWTEPDHERWSRLAEAAERRRADPLQWGWQQIRPRLVLFFVARAVSGVLSPLSRPDRDPELVHGWPFLATIRDPAKAEAWEQAWLDTRRLILEIRAVSERGGARFVLLVAPATLQVDAWQRENLLTRNPDLSLDVLRINRAIAEFCDAHALACYDPTPTFVAEADAGAALFHRIQDLHWNAQGHRVAAEGLAAFLLADGQLAGGPNEAMVRSGE